MAKSGDGDKFGPLIIPNCQRTPSQEEKLRSCPFARQSQVFTDDIQSLAQDIGIALFTLPESSDEYHTPPEHNSCSQNSSNDGQLPLTKTSAFEHDIESGRVGDEDPIPVDDDGKPQGHSIVDLTNESDQMDVDDRVHKTNAASSVCRNAPESTRQVFVEMPQRGQETSNSERRKLPFSMKAQKQTRNYSKYEAFTNSLNCVLKMAGKGKSRGGCGDDEDHVVDIDFLETAKMRGLTLPRPRWWPPEGFND